MAQELEHGKRTHPELASDKISTEKSIWSCLDILDDTKTIGKKAIGLILAEKSQNRHSNDSMFVKTSLTRSHIAEGYLLLDRCMAGVKRLENSKRRKNFIICFYSSFNPIQINPTPPHPHPTPSNPPSTHPYPIFR